MRELESKGVWAAGHTRADHAWPEAELLKAVRAAAVKLCATRSPNSLGPQLCPSAVVALGLAAIRLCSDLALRGDADARRAEWRDAAKALVGQAGVFLAQLELRQNAPPPAPPAPPPPPPVKVIRKREDGSFEIREEP